MTATATAKRTAKKGPVVKTIPVAKIEADPDQPRKQFTEEELAELAASMQSIGQLQPVAVRKTAKAGQYRLVVGERRWRAAQQGGIEELHALIWEMDDETAFIAQVAENVNRQDMTPMEEAAAYQRLAAAGWETERIAELFGKSQPYIGWRIDLLGLIDDAKALVAKGQLQVGVAWYVCRLSTATCSPCTRSIPTTSASTGTPAPATPASSSPPTPWPARYCALPTDKADQRSTLSFVSGLKVAGGPTTSVVPASARDTSGADQTGWRSGNGRP
ncbi:ParB/RepB/Spo0J family partition protein [Micromonospora aurantiaca]|nr:ParB/RepB/Spo0J family partition protein [Micromonospora aurantiaca]